MAIKFSSNSKAIELHELYRDANALAIKLRPTNNPYLIVSNSAYETLVSWLACWKSGSYFITFDPSLSPRIFEEVIHKSCPEQILFTNDVSEYFSICGRAIGVNLSDCVGDKSEDTFPWEQMLGREGLAYGAMTGGTTGQVKIALNTYKGLFNRLQWMNKHLRHPGLCTTLTTPTAYDSSLWQLLWPVIFGGDLIIPPVPLSRRPDFLSDIIREFNVSTVDFTPTQFDTFVQTSSDGIRYPSVKLVIFGGEQLFADQLSIARSIFPQAKIWNLYGPSECAIGSVAFNATNYFGPSPVPIGYPIDNTFVTLINSGSQKSGELILSGDCVGLGYLNDQVRTVEKFYIMEKTQLIEYRTGDLCLESEEHGLIFLGRRDGVIKRHGISFDVDKWLLIFQAYVEGIVIQETKLDLSKGIIEVICTNKIEKNIETVVQKVEVFVRENPLSPGVAVALQINTPRSQSASGKLLSSSNKYRLLIRLNKVIIDTAFGLNKYSQLEVLEEEIFRSHFFGSIVFNDNASLYDIGGDSLSAVALEAAFQSRGLTFDLEAALAGLPLKEVISKDARHNSKVYDQHSFRKGSLGEKYDVAVLGATGNLGKAICAALWIPDSAVLKVSRSASKDYSYHSIDCDLSDPFSCGELKHVLRSSNVKKIFVAAGSINWIESETRNHPVIVKNILSDLPKDISVTYISSLSVYRARANQCIFGQYPYHKLAAEELILRNRRNVSIVRVGLIGERDGTGHKSTYLTSLLRQIDRAGWFPVFPGVYLDIGCSIEVAKEIVTRNDSLLEIRSGIEGVDQLVQFFAHILPSAKKRCFGSYEELLNSEAAKSVYGQYIHLFDSVSMRFHRGDWQSIRLSLTVPDALSLTRNMLPLNKIYN